MRKGPNSRYSGGRQLRLSLILLAMIAPNWLAPCFANVADTASYDERLQSLTNNDNYLGDLRRDQVNFWPAASLPIKVFVHPGADVAGYKPIYLDFLKNALKQWTDATDGKLTFTIVEQPVDDGIDVTWTPKSGHEHGGEAGLAKVKVGPAGIQSANVYLYIFPGDANAQFDDVGMMGACLHEIGHSMGMPGHSLQPGDIMCAQEVIDSSATTGGVELSARDRNTLLSIMKLGPRRSEDVIAAAMAGKHLDNQESAHVCVDLITAAAAEIRQGNFQAAIEKLDKCLEIDPGNSFALTDLAAAYTSWANQFYDQKQYARAADLFAKTLTYLDKQAKPDKDSVAGIVGIYLFCLRQSGNDAQARRVEATRHIVSPAVDVTSATKEAQKVDADSDVVTETNLGKVRKKTDSQSLVAQTATESNNESTHNACVDLNNSANHDITAGNNKAAVEKLEKCLHMEPGYALAADNLEVAYYNWGIQMYSQHQYAGAVDMLAKALNCLDKLASPRKEKLMDCLKAYALSLQLSGNDAGAQKAQERLDKISAN